MMVLDVMICRDRNMASSPSYKGVLPCLGHSVDVRFTIPKPPQQQTPSQSGGSAALLTEFPLPEYLPGQTVRRVRPGARIVEGRRGPQGIERREVGVSQYEPRSSARGTSASPVAHVHGPSSWIHTLTSTRLRLTR